MASSQAQVLFRTCVTSPPPIPPQDLWTQEEFQERPTYMLLKSGLLVQGLGAGKTSINYPLVVEVRGLLKTEGSC